MIKTTNQEKIEWEMQAYGCSKDKLTSIISQVDDPLMLAAGMLSDAQEVISGEFGEPDTEVARQLMNRAKFIIFSQMRDEREAA